MIGGDRQADAARGTENGAEKHDGRTSGGDHLKKRCREWTERASIGQGSWP